jgi:flagellar motor switch protein FliG
MRTATAAEGKLGGARRAAVLMILLGEEVAVQIYRTLSERAVQMITAELSTLTHVAPESAEMVLEEYIQLSKTQEYIGQGGHEYALRLLVNAYGETRAHELLDQVSNAETEHKSRLASLQKADPQQLAKFLEGEHPQTIALILGHMEARQASALLTKLPEQVQSEAVKRLAMLRQFSPEMAEKVSMVLNRKLQSLGEQSRRTYAGFKSVADLMNRLDATSARSILENIEASEPKLATNIRNFMFTFEDLLSVSDVSIRELTSNLDKKTLALALKGATEDLRDHIFRTMSSRAVDMLKEDIDALGPVRSREVTKAQQEAVAIARQLESEGRIVLKTETDDEYLL